MSPFVFACAGNSTSNNYSRSCVLRGISLFGLVIAFSGQALSQGEVCQVIADTYASDNDLKSLSVPMRKPTTAELSVWPDYRDCKGFTPTLEGYYEHPLLPSRLLSTDVATGMRVSYTEILKAPPDCGNPDWKMRYGDALFNFNNREGLSTKLVIVEGKPVFVIGGFGKEPRVEGLTEAILVNEGTATKACSFSRRGEIILSEQGPSSICNSYRNNQFLHGAVTKAGMLGKYELPQRPGVITFQPGQPDEIVLTFKYTSVADAYPIQSVSISGKTISSEVLKHWEELIVKDGFGDTAPEWILLQGRPAAVQHFPTQTIISWPNENMETCVLKLSPQYEPAEPMKYTGAKLAEPIGP